MPLLGFAQAGSDAVFDDRGFPSGKGWDEIVLPSAEDEHAYALEISGDAMRPAYRDGDIIVVSPRDADPARRPRGGENHRRRSDDRGIETPDREDAGAAIAESRTSAERTLAASDVAWIARIVWARQ